jgi:hypothetical protein
MAGTSRPLPIVILFLFALVASSFSGCSRAKRGGSTDAGDAGTPTDARSVGPRSELANPSFTRGFVSLVPEEAPRSRLDADPILAAYLPAITRLVDGGAPGKSAVQSTALSIKGRRAILVGDRYPQLFVFDDREPDPVWMRERAVAGITPPIGQFALAAAPKGRVALAIVDPPTSMVALRIIDQDGSPFADLESLAFTGPAELSLLYWQNHGWVVVTSGGGITRAQLVSEDAKRTWGTDRAGIDVAGRPRAGSPVAIIADTDDSLMMVQITRGASDDGTFHAYAFRYDARGEALLKSPIDLGAVKPASAKDRAVLTGVRPGVVTAKLPDGVTVEVHATGEVILR